MKLRKYLLLMAAFVVILMIYKFTATILYTGLTISFLMAIWGFIGLGVYSLILSSHGHAMTPREVTRLKWACGPFVWIGYGISKLFK